MLLEGIPGLGKTELVKTLVKVLGWTEGVKETYQYPKDYAGYRRIQFTPDLMPLDVIGSEVFNQETRQIAFQPGPIFTHILLADEINRASPKTQSALLQAMAELEATYGNTIRPLGVVHSPNGAANAGMSPSRVDRLFFVIATQNPVEQQGTYPLPEAQLDRFFFKLITPLPGIDQMVSILDHTTSNEPPVIESVENLAPHEIAKSVLDFRKAIREIEVDGSALRKISLLVALTWPEAENASLAYHIRRDLKQELHRMKKDKNFEKSRESLQQQIDEYVQMGIGPRGAQTLLLTLKVRAALQGIDWIDDSFVAREAGTWMVDAWRHRLLLNFQAENDQVGSDKLIGQIADISWVN